MGFVGLVSVSVHAESVLEKEWSCQVMTSVMLCVEEALVFVSCPKLF